MAVESTTQERNGRNWKIEAVRRKLDASEREIEVAEKHLAGLRKQQCGLKEELNANTAAILSLPIEILVEIFLLLIRQTQDATVLRSQIPVPFIIGGVCKAWRNTAWATPRIWETIAITFSSARIKSQNQLLQEWIYRSASCPLYVYLKSESLDVDTEYESEYEDEDLRYYYPPEETFAILFACSDRWRILDARISNNFIQEVASGNIRLPALYELCLSVRNCGMYNVAELNWDLSSSHTLKRVDLTMQNHHLLTIDWHNLSHLKVCIEPVEWLRILQSCPSLESCSLVYAKYLDESLQPNSTQTFISLSNLLTLSITATPSTAGTILGFITAPKLESFTLDLLKAMGETWSGETVHFLRRSSCPLTGLDLLNIRTSEYVLISLLATLKTITRFNLTMTAYPPSSISHAFINALNPSVEKGFMPNLKELSLEGTFTPDADQTTLLDMIKARLAPPQPEDDSPATVKIQKLHITYFNQGWTQKMNPNSLQSFYHEVNKLSDAGASLRIFWKDVGY